MKTVGIFALLIFVLGSFSIVYPFDLEIEYIEVPGAMVTEVRGINNSGAAVGTSWNPYRGFLQDAEGNITTWAIRDFRNATDAFGLNDGGDIVGVFWDDSEGGGYIGYKLDAAGDTTIIQVPGATSTLPHGINNGGIIAGDFRGPGFGGTRGFLRDAAGNYTILEGPPGAGRFGHMVLGINDKGEIVGHFNSSIGARGFLRDTMGNYIILDVPGNNGNNATYPTDINNHGEIVGYFYHKGLGIPGGVHGFLRDKAGNYKTLNVPGAAETRILGVNDMGEIVGWCKYGSEQTRSFIAKYQLRVAIDIKPGSSPNSINLKSKGRIPVALLSNKDFNPLSQVDLNFLTFGRTGDERSLAFCHASEDFNGDGLQDLLCHFYAADTMFVCGDTEGILKGLTKEGMPIEGSSSVKITPCNKRGPFRPLFDNFSR